MKKKNNDISVLLCVYNGDNADFLRQAITSILKQTLQPSEIIIIVDGYVNKKLQKVLSDYSNNSLFKIIFLKENLGVGPARNEGLKYCSYDLVAIMDADDIMVENRLELQQKEFNKDPKLKLLGGQIVEFKDNNIHHRAFSRIVPLSRDDILRYARKASPFNNVTVMYRKSAVLKVGGYPPLNRGEDYCLYAKMLSDGCVALNLSETLVYVRFDKNSLKRRKTWRHTKETILAKKTIRDLGICSNLDLLSFSLSRFIIFIIPFPLMQWAYRRVRKNV